MTRSLSPEEVAGFRKDGLLFPKRVLSADAAAGYLAELEAYEASIGEPVNGAHRYKCHLLFPWINDLMRQPQILDMVEDLLGPDLMIWTTHLYPKEPGDGRFISWHQDSAHWGLATDDIVTVWIALTVANKQNGCMRMLPGSQIKGTVDHHDSDDPNNILTRGQTISDQIDEAKTVSIELLPGEASIHHLYMMHASHANHSTERRVAVALRYITPQAKQTRVTIDYATLVRGEDRFGNFEQEPRPSAQFDPEFVKLHEHIAGIQGQVYMHGTNKAGVQGLSDNKPAPAASK